MSSAAPYRAMGSAVAHSALGTLAAQRLMAELRAGHADEHLLFDTLARELDRRNPVRLRAFARHLQKCLQDRA